MKVTKSQLKELIRHAIVQEIKIPFSSSHIKQLKRAFKDMKGTLPDNNPLVQQIVTLLKKTDKKVLKQIASADIKYLSDKAKDILGEGTCGYGENGELGEEPAGPHLIKKKKIKEKKLNEAKPYETILKQLGGNRFIAMTGAKNLGTNGKDLSFSIGRNAKKVTHVHIKLTSMDLYDVEFINMRGAKRKVIKKVKGVYGDMLPKIFQKYTGMRTKL